MYSMTFCIAAHSLPLPRIPNIDKSIHPSILTFIHACKLLESHFVQFATVARSLLGKDMEPSITVLLVVTSDSYLHILKVGHHDAISLQDVIPEAAMRWYLANKNGNAAFTAPEATMALALCHVRVLPGTHCGVKITHKSSTSARCSYKFILPNEEAQGSLVNLLCAPLAAVPKAACGATVAAAASGLVTRATF
jgi:hypothetical protein